MPVVSPYHGLMGIYFNREKEMLKKEILLSLKYRRLFYTLKSLFNLHQSPSTCIIRKIYKMYNVRSYRTLLKNYQSMEKKLWKKLFTFTMFNEKRPHCCILYNRCVLCFKFYMQIEMEQKSPFSRSFVYIFFLQATIRHAFLTI